MVLVRSERTLSGLKKQAAGLWKQGLRMVCAAITGRGGCKVRMRDSRPRRMVRDVIGAPSDSGFIATRASSSRTSAGKDSPVIS